jgi:hypothetical protein
MLHAGLDLSRRKLDVCLLSDRGEHLDQLAVPPDVDSLRRLARRIDEVHGEPVCAVVESMTGARLVHDTLEREGWAVEIADAQRVKGLAPLACKTDKTDSLVLATLSQRDLVPAIWLPDPGVREVIRPVRALSHAGRRRLALDGAGYRLGRFSGAGYRSSRKTRSAGFFSQPASSPGSHAGRSARSRPQRRRSSADQPRTSPGRPRSPSRA